MKTIICVTPADINTANMEIGNKRHLPNFDRGKCCPIAQSLKRRNIKFDRVSGLGYVVMKNGKHATLSEKAMDFINNFDNENAVKPIKLELNL